MDVASRGPCRFGSCQPESAILITDRPILPCGLLTVHVDYKYSASWADFLQRD